jgi:hypothetical protein
MNLMMGCGPGSRMTTRNGRLTLLFSAKNEAHNNAALNG